MKDCDQLIIKPLGNYNNYYYLITKYYDEMNWDMTAEGEIARRYGFEWRRNLINALKPFGIFQSEEYFGRHFFKDYESASKAKDWLESLIIMKQLTGNI